jgi:hypothetical protein
MAQQGAGTRSGPVGARRACPMPPHLLRGYCPRCDALAPATERAPGTPAAPLACAACRARLHPPFIVTRRPVPGEYPSGAG